MRGRTMAMADRLREALLAQNPTDQQREAIFAEELEFLLRAAQEAEKPGHHVDALSGERPTGLILSADWLSCRSQTLHPRVQDRHDQRRAKRPSPDPNYVGTFDSFVERYILAPFGHLLTGSDKRPKLFPGPRPGDWNNTQLKVWTDGKGGRKIPVPAWEVIPFPEGTKLRFKASPTFGVSPLPPRLRLS